MDDATRTGLTAFLIYLPLFLVLLLIVIKKYKGFLFNSLWFSNLGDTRSSGSVIFNFSLFLYGLLSLFLARGLSEILPGSVGLEIAVVSLCVCSVATMLTSLMPMNKNLEIHHKFSNTVFISVTIASLFLVYPVYVSDIIQKYLLIFNILIVILSVLVTVSFVMLIRKHGKIPENLFDIRSNEQSLVIRNVVLWEWLLLLTVILWNFVLGVSVLKII